MCQRNGGGKKETRAGSPRRLSGPFSCDRGGFADEINDLQVEAAAAAASRLAGRSQSGGGIRVLI
jgi:hypothetical protein